MGALVPANSNRRNQALALFSADGARLAKSNWEVKRRMEPCPPKIEMSSRYQSRNVRFMNARNHWGFAGTATEFRGAWESDRASLVSSPIGGLEWNLGLSLL